MGVNLPPFQVFLDEHATPLFRFVVARVGRADAEDVFQETVLAALRAWPDLDHVNNLVGWLFTIARRKTIDTYRARGRRPEPVEKVPENPDGPVPLPDPELWESVRDLPPKQSEAIYHRFVGDFAYSQIGEVMGISEEAVRQNVYQGLKKLRTRWKR